MTAATATVYCSLLGDGRHVFVDISIDKTVRDLLLAIASILFGDDPVKRACTLKLYIPTNPHHGDKRLTIGPDLDALLEDGVVPSDGFRELHPKTQLGDSKQCFGATFPAIPDQIHVLIELLDDPRPVMRRCLEDVHWTYAKGDFRRLEVGESDPIVSIPYDYVQGSGLHVPKKDAPLVLYRREAFARVWNEIQYCSIEHTGRLHLVGAPGAGKSSAAYAFACACVGRKEWIVVWIHWSPRRKLFSLVKFEGNNKATARVSTLRREALKDMLLEFEANGNKKKLVVFLDGYNGSTESLKVQVTLLSWQTSNWKQCRFVCISAQGFEDRWNDDFIGRRIHNGSPGRHSVDQDNRLEVWSWTLEEYLAAIREPRFVASVPSSLLDGSAAETSVRPKKYFLRSSSSTESVEALVRNKFVVVGGNARNMFCRSTGRAVASLTHAVARVSDQQTLLCESIGRDVPTPTNKLFARYPQTRECASTVHLVSAYAAREVTKKLGLSSVDELATTCPSHGLRRLRLLLS